MGQTFSQLSELESRLGNFMRPGLPKYIALRDAVASLVTSGAWPPGTRLPTESECAAELPLSLGTIQRALRMLLEDGVISRRQGSGTFVAERHMGTLEAPLHCRFLDDTGKAYLPVYPEVLGRYKVREAGPWSEHLGTMDLLCIERTLQVGDEFKVYSRFYMDPERLPALATMPLRKLVSENFKTVIWRESHQPVGRLKQFLSPLDLPADICDAIGAPEGTPGQLLEISAFVGRDSPIYYQHLYIPRNGRKMHLASDGRDPGL